MSPGNEFAPGSTHPPHVDHSIVTSSFVVEVVQNAGNVTMTIVAADIVHPTVFSEFPSR